MSEVDVLDVEVDVEAEVASVEAFGNGWHLVTFGCWQIGVSEDGQIRLPFSVPPQTAGDFVEAVRVAGEVGLAVQAENEERARAAELLRPGALQSRGGVVVTAGPPPDGAVRLPVVSRFSKG